MPALRIPSARPRRRTRRAAGLLAGALAATVGAACAGGADAASDRWSGTVDSLPGGAVVVHNPAEGTWDSTSAWRLEEELRIGTEAGDEPGAFSDVYGLVVDPAGRMYVLDRQARVIQQFGADGAYVRSIGRRGGGPGEFADPIGLAWAPDGTLWVSDPGNARYAVFDTAGRYLGAHRRLVAGYSVPFRGGFDAAGHFLDQAFVRSGDEGRPVLLRYALRAGAGNGDAAPDTAPTLVVTDTVELPAGPEVETWTVRTASGSIGTSPPFAPQMVWTLDREGRLWFGGNDRYRIHLRTAAGDTLRVVERAGDPPPVTDADRAGVEEQYAWFTKQGGRIDPSAIPATKPHFSAIHVTPAGELWVRPTRERDAPGTRFDVFDAGGRFLGALDTPLRVASTAPVFVGDRVYAVVRDELDVAYLVRLRVVRGQENGH